MVSQARLVVSQDSKSLAESGWRAWQVVSCSPGSLPGEAHPPSIRLLGPQADHRHLDEARSGRSAEAALTAHRAGVCDDVVPGSKHQPARTASSRNEPLRFGGTTGGPGASQSGPVIPNLRRYLEA